MSPIFTCQLQTWRGRLQTGDSLLNQPRMLAAVSTLSPSSVIVRMPNWIGDALMALPCLERLHHAGLAITCCGRGWLPDLMSACPWSCMVLPKGLWAGAAALRIVPARDMLLLTNSLGTALQARCAGKRPFGYRADGRSLLLHRSLARQQSHEVERFWALAGLLLHRRPDSAGATLPQRLHLPLPATALEAAHSRLAVNGITAPFTVWCPLATGTIAGRDKRWPGFREAAAKRILAGECIVSLPGPGEEAATRACLPGAEIITGTSLIEAAAICRLSRGVLSNDTGPMHIAAASGCPVLGIFGVGDPQRTRPWGGAWIGSADGWPSVDAVLERWQGVVAQASI